MTASPLEALVRPLTPLEALVRLAALARMIDANEAPKLYNQLQGELAVAEAVMRQAPVAAQPVEDAGPVAWGILNDTCPELTNDKGLGDYWARKGRKVTSLYAAPPPAAQPSDDVVLKAKRYDWLRMCDWFDSPMCVVREPKKVLSSAQGLGADCPSRDRLDAAIDEAMAKEKT